MFKVGVSCRGYKIHTNATNYGHLAHELSEVLDLLKVITNLVIKEGMCRMLCEQPRLTRMNSIGH